LDSRPGGAAAFVSRRINMSERSREKARAGFRKFTPAVSGLEGRLLPNGTGHTALPDARGTTRGGVAIQTGTLLGVTVDRFAPNTVHVAYDGAGDVQVKWNAGRYHSFSGVETVDIHAQGVRRDTMTFTLAGQASPAFVVAAGSSGQAEPASVNNDGGPGAHALSDTPYKNHGDAIASGAVLTVAVDDPKGNSVQLSDAGSGDIQVAWNGGPAYSFTGITTIVVHAKQARNDQVILTGPMG
jgi:hypothetical protein